MEGHNAEVDWLERLVEEGRGDDNNCGGDSGVIDGGEDGDGDKRESGGAELLMIAGDEMCP